MVVITAAPARGTGDGIEVRALPGGPGGGAFGWPGVGARVRERPLRAMGAALWIARGRRTLFDLVRQRDVRDVRAHWAVPCGWPLAVGTSAKVAVEGVSHGADVRLLLALHPRARTWMVRRALDTFETWRFVSEDLRRRLLDALPSPVARDLESRSHVHPPPLELPDVSSEVTRRRAELRGAELYAVVGRLTAGKRVHRAVEHVASLQRERGAGPLPVLVVVGDGPERGRLESLARARGVDARFVGHVSHAEALAWTGAARALLFAGQGEGLPTVLREAQALGVETRLL